MLASLTQTRKARTLRASSWGISGRNGDAWAIEGGETRVLADLNGPGCITHIWMTQSGEGAFRNVVLKMFWDGEEDPSVEVPLGDFFCLGHGISTSFQSLPFSASANAQRENQFVPNAALNCYLQMPFNLSARIEVANEGDEPYRQYFLCGLRVIRRPLGRRYSVFSRAISQRKSLRWPGGMKFASIRQRRILSMLSGRRGMVIT